MRASEFTKIEEGIGDWFARKGLFGRGAAMAAHMKQMDQEQQAVSAQVRQQNYNKFIKELPVSIESGISSGLVKANSKSIADFVKKYVGQLFKNYSLDTNTQFAIDKIIAKFGLLYRNQRDPKNPVLSGQSLTGAKAIWDAYESASKLTSHQGSDSQSKQYPFPAETETVVTEKGKYEFDPAQKKWFRTHINSGSINEPIWTPSRVEQKDPTNINALNAKAASV